ncbi:MAG: DNA polymerase ligase N-terminal domain-containing protein [Patescibacteria group bacterium]
MSLAEYKRKRKFDTTTEPKPVIKRSRKGNIYSIQEHHARNLHWDLRLEKDGVLMSFAMPKIPPRKSGLKRLAVRTEDHPLDYALWTGSIPAGQYGAGTVTLWDQGTYDVIDEKKGKKYIININGQKLHGRYALVKFKKNYWLFFKMKRMIIKD